MSVNVEPMPRGYLKIHPSFRPRPAPIFDGDRTPDEVQLARALFLELDPESQAWYGRGGVFEGI